jgi:hypothetical protein
MFNRDTQEVVKRTHICHREFPLKSYNNLSEITLGQVRENNIIHLEKQEGCVSTSTVDEQGSVCLRLNKAMRCDVRSEVTVPSVRGLL